MQKIFYEFSSSFLVKMQSLFALTFEGNFFILLIACHICRVSGKKKHNIYGVFRRKPQGLWELKKKGMVVE